jgi:hypothetical protein
VSVPECKLELDNVEHALKELHDGIDYVLDALAIIRAEKPGSLELTYALGSLRSAYTVLENEVESSKREAQS